jgi:transcriptional regulator with XRE-family HTH domain
VLMALGALIRDLRLARGWSQLQLATELSAAASRADGSPGRDQVKRWESGKVIPGRWWLAHLARVLDTPMQVLEAEATLSRMDRRAFLSLTALTAAHGRAASDMLGSVAGGDPGPLATVQTTHGTDLVIAALADKPSLRYLRRWASDGADPVLRVNAAGVLAKTADQGAAREVAQILTHDTDVRALYSTAVVARTCAVDWPIAQQLAADPLSMPGRAAYLARRLLGEVTNARDAGARWCSAAMLRDLSPLLGR